MKTVDDRLRSEYRRPHRVWSLDERDLDDECALLCESVMADGIQPTHIVAIATAGTYVARSMAAAMPGDVPVLEISARRVSTTLKERLQVRRLARHLPRPVTDVLRRVELRLVTSRLPVHRTVAMPPEDEAVLRGLEEPAHVLVVDDCVDTGGSLDAAMRYCREQVRPGVHLSSAVLTVSTVNPLVRPDVNLHENTQFRGPWSYDAR